jgi:hypothetical protein
MSLILWIWWDKFTKINWVWDMNETLICFILARNADFETTEIFKIETPLKFLYSFFFLTLLYFTLLYFTFQLLIQWVDTELWHVCCIVRNPGGTSGRTVNSWCMVKYQLVNSGVARFKLPRLLADMRLLSSSFSLTGVFITACVLEEYKHVCMWT